MYCSSVWPAFLNTVEFLTFSVLFHVFSIGHKLSFLMLMTYSATAIKEMSNCRRKTH